MVNITESFVFNTIPHDNITTSRIISIVLYAFSFLYALLHVLLRTWINNEHAKDRENSVHNNSFRLFNQQRISTDLPRADLLRISCQISCAFLLRLIWLCYKVLNNSQNGKESPEQHNNIGCYKVEVGISAINRLAQLLLFSAFYTVATFWADIYRRYQWNGQHQELTQEDQVAVAIARSSVSNRTPITATTTLENGELVTQAVQPVPPLDTMRVKSPTAFSLSLLLSPNFIQKIVSFWVYLCIFVLILVQFFQCDKALNNRISNAETVVIACFYLFLSVFFVVYGMRIGNILASFQSMNRQNKQIQRAITFICCLCISLFFIRGVLFILKPIFGVVLHGVAYKIAYPWFFYTIPELAPSLVILYISTPKPHRRALDSDVLPSAPNQHTPLISSQQTNNAWI